MDTEYAKHKTKYMELQNGGGKGLIFLFFNGGGLDNKQWFEHPYKGKGYWLNRDKEKSKTKLINKLEKLGDVYLQTPKFYLTSDDIKNGKTFTVDDLDLTKYSNNLYNNIKKYKNIFIISHSRGNIMAKFFCQLYAEKIIGYINIDGGEADEWIEKKVNEWNKLYSYIDDIELKKLFVSCNDDAKCADIISRFVKYKIYKQCLENKYTFNNIDMLILNNIYNDSEISIADSSYVTDTLISKFNFNKKFEHNESIKSLFYVGKTHFLYFYDDVEGDIIDFIIKMLHKHGIKS